MVVAVVGGGGRLAAVLVVVPTGGTGRNGWLVSFAAAVAFHGGAYGEGDGRDDDQAGRCDPGTGEDHVMPLLRGFAVASSARWDDAGAVSIASPLRSDAINRARRTSLLSEETLQAKAAMS